MYHQKVISQAMSSNNHHNNCWSQQRVVSQFEFNPSCRDQSRAPMVRPMYRDSDRVPKIERVLVGVLLFTGVFFLILWTVSLVWR
jgi:hypothetical protein